MGLFSRVKNTYNRYVLVNCIKRRLKEIFWDWYDFREDWSVDPLPASWSAQRAKLSTSFLSPSMIKYTQIQKEIDKTKYGHFSINPEAITAFYAKKPLGRYCVIEPILPELFAKRRIFIPELQSFNGKTTAEVGEYIGHTYGDTYYVPGLEYYIWLVGLFWQQNVSLYPEVKNLRVWPGTFMFLRVGFLRRHGPLERAVC